jgi:hypothetical protein
MSLSNPQEVAFCLALVRAVLAEMRRVLAVTPPPAAGDTTSELAHAHSIGVITPYQNQLRGLRRAFQSAGLLGHHHQQPNSNWTGAGLSSDPLLLPGGHGRAHVELNTIDGFQGREKDIIIFSCVRAAAAGAAGAPSTTPQSIGFLADPRRLNVAITRARFALYVVGHGATLSASSELWGRYLSFLQLIPLDSAQSASPPPCPHSTQFNSTSLNFTQLHSTPLNSTQFHPNNNAVY